MWQIKSSQLSFPPFISISQWNPGTSSYK
ncbi:hypothetical protein A2U01_0076858, partial [Trifolium medium]|nr:hypothetical protein [Trifolium medium]